MSVQRRVRHGGRLTLGLHCSRTLRVRPKFHYRLRGTTCLVVADNRNTKERSVEGSSGRVWGAYRVSLSDMAAGVATVFGRGGYRVVESDVKPPRYGGARCEFRVACE